MRDEISSGHFRSVDELIKAAVEALREKNAPKSLVQFFRESPLVGLALHFEWVGTFPFESDGAMAESAARPRGTGAEIDVALMT